MMRVEKLKGWHLRELLKDPSVSSLRPFIQSLEQISDKIENQPYSFTAMKGLVPIACTGLQEYWPGRGEMWAIFTKASGTEMLPIVRAASRLLDICSVRRIEASVACDFEKGHRLVKLLGFELEAERCKAFLPDGRDASLYARVRS